MPYHVSSFIYYSTQIVQIIIFCVGCYFFSISIFGWIKKKDAPAYKYIPCKIFAVIIPAHNEELVISHIIDSLFKQNYPKNMYDVFVIADNCTDKTAQIADELEKF